jgi:nitronate monooxygenase
VLAPMAGGPSTVPLAAAAASGGMFAFLAGAYLAPQQLREDIEELRALVPVPFGVNIFAPSDDRPSMRSEAEAYGSLLAPWAASAGVELGEPRYDDDAFGAKLDVLVELAPAVVSFSFAWPPADAVARLRGAGAEVWVTLNEPDELAWAVELGVDGVVLQGWEAGGHRGGPHDSGRQQPSVDVLVRELSSAARSAELGVMAAGGVMTGRDARRLLDAGADAVAFGTAFLASSEAGTAPVHVHELTQGRGTTVTRAFTGRSARALVTTWTQRFSDAAPTAYPHVHHLTAPLRAHGKATGEAELVHLWAGTGHAAARTLPARQLAELLYEELRADG